MATFYEFRSIELKQTAFRLDGVLVPSAAIADQTVYFVEVQFQNDPYFYQRFFAEIFLYLRQNPERVRWQAVVLFARRSIEPQDCGTYTALLNSPQVQRIYLEELGQTADASVGIGLIQLVVLRAKEVPDRAKDLLNRARSGSYAELSVQAIVELIETIVVYKFPSLSREAIEQMLGLISELKQTRVYQEAREEGVQEGRQEGRLEEGISLVHRLLTCRVGPVPDDIQTQVQSLSMVQVEALGEALLDFTSMADLEAWMQSADSV